MQQDYRAVLLRAMLAAGGARPAALAKLEADIAAGDMAGAAARVTAYATRLPARPDAEAEERLAAARRGAARAMGAARSVAKRESAAAAARARWAPRAG